MQHILTDAQNKLHSAESIIIAGKHCKEIVGYSYELTRNDIESLLIQDLKPNNVLDAEERDDMLKFFNDFDFSDLNSRQCTMQPKYKEDANKAGCISCLQALIREDQVHLFVHVRSQNFDTNFLYDNQSYSMIIDGLARKFNLSIFKVFIRVVSLHKIY